MKKFGLLDCNNFFVSCERVFDPKLKDRPVIVLSSNDGCAVARSNEVKKIGIAMGTPVFKIGDLIKKHKIHIKSTNFELYRDMSNRIMNVLKEFVDADSVEIYSIDEAFFDLSSQDRPIDFCKKLKKLIYQYTGIPVSIGIGETKTLAKLANREAKNRDGVFEINILNRDTLFINTKIDAVWGLGKKTAKKIEEQNIKNLKQLCDLKDDLIQKKFGKKSLDTISELRGLEIFPFQNIDEDRKSIISSKSFKGNVLLKKDLSTALSGHIEKAIYQLRLEGLLARKLEIRISTSLFSKNKYVAKANIVAEVHSDDFFVFIAQLEPALSKIYKKGFNYKKTGVCFSDIVSKNSSQSLTQQNLWNINLGESKKSKISDTISNIKNKYGFDSIRFATSKTTPVSTHKIYTNSEFKSPNYTTNLDELLEIK